MTSLSDDPADEQWLDDQAGRIVKYDAPGISVDMSLLEMLDVVNEGLIKGGEDPIAFDHDCREGICGSCGFMINGVQSSCFILSALEYFHK